MRVLYISTNFTALSHTFITREINQLRKMGVEVHLLSLRISGTSATTVPECDLTGCHFVYPAPFWPVLSGILRNLNRSPSRCWRAVRMIFSSDGDSLKTKFKLLYQLAVASRFADLILAQRIQHVHAHFAGSPTTFALVLHILTGVSYSFTDHGAGLYHDRVALDLKFSHASGISAISQYNIDYYHKLQQRLPTVRIVRCGLDMESFPFRLRTSCHDPLRILAVSRLVPKKGFSYLLEALSMLSERGIRWQGHLVGEGPLLESLQAQAAELGLSDLEFTGPLQQEEVRHLMDQADVFVLPCVVAPDGDMDGIPVTLMEAMACGCPVISTRVSGIPELVIDGQTGILLEPEDAVAIAVAIECLSRDTELVRQLSQGGHDWVAGEFNIVSSARNQRDFFVELTRDTES